MTEPIDAAEREDENRQRGNWLMQQSGYQGSLTENDAYNLVNSLGNYPNMTSEAAVASMVAGVEWDSPFMKDIASRDFDMQESAAPWRYAKAAARGVFGVADSWWEAGPPSVGRTAQRIAQGENPYDAYRKSNVSYLSAWAREKALGNPTETGTGIFPNSTPYHQRQGFDKDFREQLAITGDIDEAYQAAALISKEKYGAVLTTNVHDVANSSLTQKTWGDKLYATPYSGGRTLMIQLVKPDEPAFQVMSALIDGSMRLGLDPINPWAKDLTVLMKHRKRIMPDLRDVVAGEIRSLRRERYGITNVAIDGDTLGDTSLIGSTRAGERPDIRMDLDSIDKSWEEFVQKAIDDPDSIPYYTPDDTPLGMGTDAGGMSPYGVPYDERQMTNKQLYDALEERGGVQAYEDFILEHELVHQQKQKDLAQQLVDAGEGNFGREYKITWDQLKAVDDEIAALDPKAAGYDEKLKELTARGDSLDADLGVLLEQHTDNIKPILRQLEYDAEQQAISNMLDGSWQAPTHRQELYRASGLTSKWRRYLRPREASELIRTGKLDGMFDWLARESRWEQIDKRLGMIPMHTQMELGRATERSEVIRILKPYLGLEVSKIPNLGVAKYGGFIQFAGGRPSAGGAKHTFDSQIANQIRRTGRRLGAQSLPTILNPLDPQQSARVAVEVLKTVKATDDQIQSAVKLIAEAGGSHSYAGMSDAKKVIENILVDRLKTLGYNEGDLKKILESFNSEMAQSNIYWVNYATNPHQVTEMDSAMGILLGAEGDLVPHLSAATEAQFSNTFLPIPNLRDLRRATSPARAFRESTLRRIPGLKETRLGFDPGYGLGTLDSIHKVWRDAMLMRMGWPIRVVGEEMLRAHAYGYGQWLSHPMDLFGQFAASEGRMTLLNDSIKDIIKLDGLGAGSFRDKEQTVDMARQIWTTVRQGETGYTRGVVQELVQLSGSRIVRSVAVRGIDETMRWLRETEEGKKLIIAISQRSARDGKLYKMASSDQVLYRHLQSVDAMLAQAGGGRWVQRSLEEGAGGQRIWKGMDGEQVIPWSERTKQQLVEASEAAGLTVTSRMKKQEIIDQLVEATGKPDLATVNSRTEFVVVQDGNSTIRDIVGRKPDADGMTRITSDMNVEDFKLFEEQIEEVYMNADATMPEVVRTSVTDPARDEIKVGAVDRIFEMLMQNPSTAMARSPHFQTRYLEEVARMFLAADEPTKRLIQNYVIEQGIDVQWNRSIRKMLDEMGLKEVPGGAIDMDQWVDAGKLKIIDDAPTARPDTGPDLRLASIDELVESYIDELAMEEIDLMFAEMRTLEPGTSGDQQHLTEIRHRLLRGELTHDELHNSVARVEAQFRAGEIGYTDSGTPRWPYGPEEIFLEPQGTYDETGKFVDELSEQGFSPDLNLVKSQREADFVDMMRANGYPDMNIGDVYVHGGNLLQDGRFNAGGLTTDVDSAISYVENKVHIEGDREGQVHVFFRDQFPEDMAMWPRHEQTYTPDVAQRTYGRHYKDDIVGDYDDFAHNPDVGWHGSRMLPDEGVQPAFSFHPDELGGGQAPNSYYYGDLSQYLLGENDLILFEAMGLDEIQALSIDELLDEAINTSRGRLTARGFPPQGDMLRIPGQVDEVYFVTYSDIFGGRQEWIDDKLRNGSLFTNVEEARLMAERIGVEIQVIDQASLSDEILESLWGDRKNRFGMIDDINFEEANLSTIRTALPDTIEAEHFPIAWGLTGTSMNQTDSFLRREILRRIATGEVSPTDVQKAMAGAVSRNMDGSDEALEAISKVDDHISGLDGQLRGFDPITGERPGGVARVKPGNSEGMFSNEAIGIRTPDEQLLERIDRIAKHAALEDTKALFYDLTRRANFTDMARYIFPFGDAFLEQMRIWGRAMTPIGEQSGQAIMNWRKTQVGITNARKSGFFSEDEYGNEVMNWPGAGLMTGALGLPSGMASTIQPDQLMMMNLTPRGMGLPGTSPFVQVPAGMLEPHLDKYPKIRDMMNWFAFGDFGPQANESISDVFYNVTPTTLKRIAQALFGDETKARYGDEVMKTVEALIMSNDPAYGDTAETADRTLKDAQTLGTALSLFSIIDGFASPAQPRYEPSVLVGAADDPFWMTIAALGAEYRAARDYLGEDEARIYMKNRFNIDPLDIIGKTRQVRIRPSTKEAYDFSKQHEELETLMPDGMFMFLPNDLADEFYHSAYREQTQDGDRQTMTPEIAMGVRQRNKGWAALSVIDAAYDEAEAVIDKHYNGNHRDSGWSVNMNELKRWRYHQRLDVFAQYPLADSSKLEIPGLAARSTYYNIIEDLKKAGTPGTPEYRATVDLTPEISEYLVGFTTMWNNLEQISIKQDKAHSPGWWLTAKDPIAQALRADSAEYMNKLRADILRHTQPERHESVMNQIDWFMRRVLGPLYDGYDINDEMWLTMDPVPPPIFTEPEAGEQPETTGVDVSEEF